MDKILARELGISIEELRSFHHECFQSNQAEMARVTDQSNCVRVDIVDDPVSLGLLGGVVGGLSPGLFGLAASEWLLASLFGAVVGFALGKIFQNKDGDKQPKYSPTYGIDSGGALVGIGGPVPLIYCNRANNPSGGVRYGGGLINSYIKTSLGRQTLFQLYVLGLGKIGSVDPESLLIDDQPLSGFIPSDVTVFFRQGTTPNPSASVGSYATIDDFTFFSQCRSLSSNALLGCDRRASSSSTAIVISPSEGDYTNTINCFTSNGGNTIQKNTSTLAYDAGGQVNDDVEQNGAYVEWTALEVNTRRMGGFSTASAYPFTPAPNQNAMNFGLELREDGTMRVYESGVLRFDSNSLSGAARYYLVNDVFRVEVTTGGNVIYKKNSAGIYTSPTVNPPLPLYATTILYSPNATIHNLQLSRSFTYSSGSVSNAQVNEAAGTTSFNVKNDDEVTSDDYERFNSSEIYQVHQSGFPVQEFRVIGKNTQYDNYGYINPILTVAPAINITAGARIFSINRARFQTTKRVDRLDINLNAVLWARAKGDPDEKGKGKGKK